MLGARLDSHTIPKSRLQAKYAVVTWARLPSATVAMVHRFEASSSDRVTDPSRWLATGLLDRHGG